MHVLQLGPYPPPEGGVSRNMLAIRDELVAAGHTCTIIATARSTETRNEAGVHHPASPAKLVGLLRSLKYDALHLHIGGDVSRRVLAMAFACTVFGRGRKVLTLHSGAYPLTSAAKNAGKFSLHGIVFRRFDQVIAVNDAIAEVFARFGIGGEKIKVILPYALKMPDETVEVRSDLLRFYAGHSPVLLAVGGLEPDYDPLFQVAAMKTIREVLPDAGLMIVGDGSMREAVRSAVDASEHKDHICIAGNVDHAQTLHLIRDADILIRTTLFDGDAISIREALHLNTPVIATDNGMRPDGVHLIRAGNTDDLVAKVRLALEQSETTGNSSPDDNANIAAVIRLYQETIA